MATPDQLNSLKLRTIIICSSESFNKKVIQKITIGFVVKGDGPNLMGHDWLARFIVDWHSIHQLQSLNKLSHQV